MRLRRATLPAEFRDQVTLERGERPVAWGTASGAEALVPIVATDRALHVGPLAHPSRLPWDRCVRATWEEPVLDLVVQPVPGGPTRSLALRLVEMGELPVVIRERITDSVVAQHHVVLRGDKGARLVARRVADDASVRWSVVFDAGLDPRDPELRREADAALAELRSQLGI